VHHRDFSLSTQIINLPDEICSFAHQSAIMICIMNICNHHHYLAGHNDDIIGAMKCLLLSGESTASLETESVLQLKLLIGNTSINLSSVLFLTEASFTHVMFQL
jgi:hypothetical protein